MPQLAQSSYVHGGPGCLFVCLSVCVWSAMPIPIGSVSAQERPKDLKAIGGHWHVTQSEPTVYYFEDAGRYVDLFSHHQMDSNKDGIANVKLSHDNRHLIVRSQGYPNHPTAIFPNSGNPNSIRVQDFTFRFPLAPQRAPQVTRLPMGPIGMALNGVVFFNPFEIGGMNAVAGYSEVWLDSCCGHPQQTGVYHYHKYPTCVKSPFADDGHQHSPVIGLAFDGFPIYGPYESDGQMAKDVDGERALDSCSGHSDPERGYHYHVTPGRFPYIVGGYAGTPEATNNRLLRQAGVGAITDNAAGGSRLPQVIVAVRPGTVEAGRRHTLRIELDETASRYPLPDGKPDWVQIGPYEALSIAREGKVVTAEIEVDQAATLGVLLDCHIEFSASGQRLVYKKNDALRIVK